MIVISLYDLLMTIIVRLIMWDSTYTVKNGHLIKEYRDWTQGYPPEALQSFLGVFFWSSDKVIPFLQIKRNLGHCSAL